MMCADNTWKRIDNVAATAPLPHFTVGDQLWVDHIVLFWGGSLSQMRQDSAGTQTPDRAKLSGLRFMSNLLFPKAPLELYLQY